MIRSRLRPFRLRSCVAEQRRHGLPEADRQPDQGDQGHVELTALDLLQVLQVQVAPLGGLLEGPPMLLPEPTETKPQGLRFANVPGTLLVHPGRSFVGPRLRRHPPRTVGVFSLLKYLTCDECVLTETPELETIYPRRRAVNEPPTPESLRGWSR